MTEVQKSEPKDELTGAERAPLNKKVWQRKERYRPTDADRAAYNQQAQRPKERRVAPRLNEAGPGNAAPARTEVPKSGPKSEPTDARRAALDDQVQRLKEQPVAPRFGEAGLGDADRAMTEVPEPKPEYEPTDAERVVLDRLARKRERSVTPRLKVVAGWRGVWVELDHPDQFVAHLLLTEALGTADDNFYQGLLAQLYAFVGIEDSAAAEKELNLVLSTIINGKPKDEIETTLLYQMGVTLVLQNQFIQKTTRIEIEFSAIERDLRDKTFSRMINERNYSLIENLSRLMDSVERGYSRLAKTYSNLLDTLDRHRRSGEPSTTVHVAPGAQAIVGHVSHATPQMAPNNAAAGLRALTDQQHSAMSIIVEPDRVPVPVRRRKKGNGQQPSA